MKNIPVFATENGVGSLIIKDIPYTRTAYIRIESASFPGAFLEECASFCKMVGAEKIYATGGDCLCEYPLHTSVICMTCSRENLPETDAALFPVTEETLRRWLDIYWSKMKNVPNAAYMTLSDGEEMLRRGDGYFIHRGETLLGIGMAAGEMIQLVASLQPGAGREIVLALNHALFGDHVTLEVASANEKAIALYSNLGFIKTTERSKWYKIL